MKSVKSVKLLPDVGNGGNHESLIVASLLSLQAVDSPSKSETSSAPLNKGLMTND